MEINSTRFIISNQKVESCPKSDKPEFAFIGRSNVGKSSLINLIVNDKKLAKTSSTPGKTQLINHFLINEEWYMVDLPGFGYAKVSKKDRRSFSKMITDYVLNRKNLYCLFVLIDSRHEPLKLDIEFITFLGEKQVPFAIIFTKTDKLSVEGLKKNIEIYKNQLLKSWEILPPIFITSAIKRTGRYELLEFIEKAKNNSEI
ncbi:ribosome biogenesis GTP-binding protein YihA/YsxC [Bacteroidota bacterium]